MTNTPEYKTWCAMITRCYNPNQAGWTNYGGRGIKVCGRWRLSFLAFYADMGDRPEGDFSIDRIHNDGNYEPGNCRWAGRTEQNYNQRLRRDNKSGVAGVYKSSNGRGWIVQKGNKYLGCYTTKKAAIAARLAG